MADDFFKEEVELLNIPAGSGAVKVRVVERQKTNRREIDIRRFWRDDAGNLRPSPKGVLLPLDAARDIAKAIRGLPKGDLPFSEIRKAARSQKAAGRVGKKIAPKGE